MQNDRAARFLVQFYDVFCQTTTWNFHTDISQQHELAAINLSFLHENQFAYFLYTWPTWKNRKALKVERKVQF